MPSAPWACRPGRLAPDVAEDPDLPRRVVEVVYADVDPSLWGAAEWSVRAQAGLPRGPLIRGLRAKVKPAPFPGFLVNPLLQ
ncbi:hypothetical protein [Nocardioides convexus]|uniref:hypothetical protein n=1 Tax=Nocardioides convexus TaxID=2712224 RepID=UPI003101AD64